MIQQIPIHSLFTRLGSFLLGTLFWLPSDAQTVSQLSNLSTRGPVGTAGSVMIAGFVISDGPTDLLVRAAGPALGDFGLTAFLDDPVLRIFNADNQEIALNDDWLPEHAAAFAQVGAFAFPPGSRDAALVLTLAPGAYTARVSGEGSGLGVALVEVYDLSTGDGSSRLLNLSTRAEVGVGGSVLIPGLVLSPGEGPRRLLVRAIGPGLARFGVENALLDPYLTLRNADGLLLAANDNWGNPDALSLDAIGDHVGAFDLEDPNSRDAGFLVDLQPGAYTIQVSGMGGTSGVALVEVFDATPSGPAAEVTLTALDSAADESGSNTALLEVNRTGDTSAPLLVRYATAGTAFNLIDYVLLSGVWTIPAGQSSAILEIVPLPDVETEPEETVTISLLPGLGYSPNGQSEATITIANVPPLLYAASLRPDAAAPSSAGYGTAILLLSASGTIASVNVSVSNLSSAPTTAYLRLGEPGQTGDYILGLPTGQVSGAVWRLDPTGPYSGEELLGALQNGLIYLGIETENFPSGEIRGHFILASGSSAFVPPPDPPEAPATPASATEASRFLTQSTFGPTPAAIEELLSMTYAEWFDAQTGIPASLHRETTQADWIAFPTNGRAMNTRPGREHRQGAWWRIAVNGQDQLRQRVAFALSEIFVVSDENATINNWQEAAAAYYDILAEEAFGNYRTLLERVSLSPVMGAYLSHLRNARGDPGTGALPDENYAREIMQLFSIGLVELQPDGTMRLDPGGLPIPTYDQATITETAKVFTGWAFATDNPANNLFRRGPVDFFNPMSLYPGFHDEGPKTIVGGVGIPAGLGGHEDLRITLDTLFNHPNTPAFISRRLIQRLVTSNPSPSYVYRVAQVFRDNGNGIRGDLGAVVRTILLDYEARATAVQENAGTGKLREPLLRATNLFRALGAVDGNDGRFNLTNPQNLLAQAALNSPTVFNFFEPDHVQTGVLAAAGLFAPEFQILTASTAVTVPNFFYNHIFSTPSGIALNTDPLLPLLDDVPALLEELSLRLNGGRLSTQTRNLISAALASLPGFTRDIDRLRTAVYLVVNSPDAAIQR